MVNILTAQVLLVAHAQIFMMGGVEVLTLLVFFPSLLLKVLQNGQFLVICYKTNNFHVYAIPSVFTLFTIF